MVFFHLPRRWLQARILRQGQLCAAPSWEMSPRKAVRLRRGIETFPQPVTFQDRHRICLFPMVLKGPAQENVHYQGP